MFSGLRVQLLVGVFAGFCRGPLNPGLMEILHKVLKGACIRVCMRILRELWGFSLSFGLEGLCWDSGFKV